MRARVPVLHSMWEARSELSGSALFVVDLTRCGFDHLAELLAGRGSIRHLSPAARDAVRSHRQLVADLRAEHLDWLVDEELEGALSYAAGELGAA